MPLTSQLEEKKVHGMFMERDGERFYKIENYDQLSPFFMSIVSSSDHWLFISSKGGLTAGRKNADNALFPYYTDDKIHDFSELTGSKTIFRVWGKEGFTLWEPFSDRLSGTYPIKRNLYKSCSGNQIVFEEINETFSLVFRYAWMFSDQYGFVRKSTILNKGEQPISVDLLDGIQNILPYGINAKLQNDRSTLVDAYKKSEWYAEGNLGVFTLSSMIVDRAEPSEALKATVVWSAGQKSNITLISDLQLEAFRNGKGLQQRTDIRASRGAYLLNMQFDLKPLHPKSWYIVADLDKEVGDVIAIAEKVQSSASLISELEKDIQAGTIKLRKLVAQSDGIQVAGDESLIERHFFNTLFNIFRGGVFIRNYELPKRDFLAYLVQHNKSVFEKYHSQVNAFSDWFSVKKLTEAVEKSNDPDFYRLSFEYLPLMFSRRHGDPSRPWNRFSIEIRNDDGSEKLYYQGNWRDIFQNWEALCLSYPGFLPHVICKFLNASTIDGYNPYRITKDGIDWETIEPDDPWSYIGYWGDHQIIYMLKLLELSRQFDPEWLPSMFDKAVFSYANVPYKIKSYESILENPYDTVVYDEEMEQEIEEAVERLGNDGKLLLDEEGKVVHVSFLEKILVSLLAKLSNFIPEAGIWLNTQRPEWNDANNALVGNGVSMVTLYYLRRFIAFFSSVLEDCRQEQFTVSAHLSAFFQNVLDVLREHQSILSVQCSDLERREMMDALGNAGSGYRKNVYAQPSDPQKQLVYKEELSELFSLSNAYIDDSIQKNKREDGLFHAYNLINITNEKEVGIRRLYEMLEGQVAALSSGSLSAEEALNVMRALRESNMYRPDQHSYLLYPDRTLPRFLKKNDIPANLLNGLKLPAYLLENNNDSIFKKDALGNWHFNGNFHNANDLKEALNELTENGYKDLVSREKDQILDVFERVFDHQSFTGRSGTFFGYEGLGCIYWHMVSKLVLAAQENCFWALENGVNEALIQKLIDHYYDLRAGIGFNKSPEEYGAFPTDPYSHTPSSAGAQQPGMTGQVKEDVLWRFGELGLRVKNGEIHFDPFLLSIDAFLTKVTPFEYFDVNGKPSNILLEKTSLAFTYCQVPIVYYVSQEPKVEVFSANGNSRSHASLALDGESSTEITNRTGNITRVNVYIPEGKFLKNIVL